MRLIGILVLIIGVALAGGSAWFVWKQGQAMNAGPQAQAEPQEETVAIVVAKQRLPQGTRLKPSMLKWVNYPKNSVPRGAFTSAAGLLGEDRKGRRIVLRQIEQDAPVLQANLTGFDQIARVSMTLAEGRVAVSIPITETSGVAGLIAPGDRVDILMTRTVGRGMLESTTILQDTMVIAVDRLSDRETSVKRVGRTITVEVTPGEAQKLSLAQQAGRLSLTLKGMEISETPDVVDGGDAAVEPAAAVEAPPTSMTTDDLFGIDRTPKAAPAPTGTTVRVRRGNEVQNVQVQ